MGHILVFTRYPTPGEAKTRLVPALGPEGAAQLHRKMSERAVATARSAGVGHKVTVCYTGAGRADFVQWLGRDVLFRKQVNGDLGRRLRHAFSTAFRCGAQRVLAIGADVPDLSGAIITQAFEQLADHDIVIGPARDGGYYLIGVKEEQPALMTGIDWGSGHVFGQTLAAAEQQGLTMAMLPPLGDVDRPDDLDALRCDETYADILGLRSL